MVLVEQFEVARQAVHQLGDLAVVEIGGRASAPVQLRDRPLGADQFALQRHLGADLLQVAPGDARFAGHHFVAGAVIANVSAERQVHVQGQRLRVTLLARLPVQIAAQVEGFAELRGCGVGRVAGAAAGVAPGQGDTRLPFGREAPALRPAGVARPGGGVICTGGGVICTGGGVIRPGGGVKSAEYLVHTCTTDPYIIGTQASIAAGGSA